MNNKKVRTYCNKIKKGIKIYSELQGLHLSYKVSSITLKLMTKYDKIIKARKVISLYKILVIMHLLIILYNKISWDRETIKFNKILKKEDNQLVFKLLNSNRLSNLNKLKIKKYSKMNLKIMMKEMKVQQNLIINILLHQVWIRSICNKL